MQSLIVRDPKVRGGRPVVAGTGVCVSDIVAAMLFHDQTPDDLAAWFDLSLAQIYAALAYYYDNKAELDDELRRELKRAADLKEKRVGARDSLLPR
jgi:uncharacterized protein (DUF433 family)